MNVDPIGKDQNAPASPIVSVSMPGGGTRMQGSTWFVRLLNQLRDAAVSLWASGTTTQRPGDPYLGQIFYDTTLAALVSCSAIKNRTTGTPAQWIPVVTATVVDNIVIDGEDQVCQGGAATLSTSSQYGVVDMWAGWASSGAISAGTLTQDTGFAGSSTGNALKFSGYTTTGSGVLSARERIEGKRARAWKGQTVSFSCVVQHDIGAAINVTVVYRKPTAVDNFSAVTVINTSSAISVPSGAATTISVPNVALGDVSNGFELEIQAAVGAVTTKNLWISDVQIRTGTSVATFVPKPFAPVFEEVLRYFQKTFAYGTAPAQNAGNTGVVGWLEPNTTPSRSQFISFVPPMRSSGPTMTYFNPAAANSHPRDSTAGADCSAEIAAIAGNNGFGIQYTKAAGALAGDYIICHYTADARF